MWSKMLAVNSGVKVNVVKATSAVDHE